MRSLSAWMWLCHVAPPPKSQFRGQGIHTAISLHDLRDVPLENTSGPSFELSNSNFTPCDTKGAFMLTLLRPKSASFRTWLEQNAECVHAYFRINAFAKRSMSKRGAVP